MPTHSAAAFNDWWQGQSLPPELDRLAHQLFSALKWRDSGGWLAPIEVRVCERILLNAIESQKN